MIWVVVAFACVGWGVAVLLAVIVFSLHKDTVRALTESHERTVKHTEGLVDRIVAGDWSLFKAYENGEVAIVPSAPEPHEVKMVPTTGPDLGGFGSRRGLRRPLPDEEGDEL